jgi:hypothetical protein
MCFGSGTDIDTAFLLVIDSSWRSALLIGAATERTAAADARADLGDPPARFGSTDV